MADDYNELPRRGQSVTPIPEMLEHCYKTTEAVFDQISRLENKLTALMVPEPSTAQDALMPESEFFGSQLAGNLRDLNARLDSIGRRISLIADRVDV